LRQLSFQYKIGEDAVQRRWKKYSQAREEGKSQDESLTYSVKDNRGGHNRIFSPQNELLLADIIKIAQPPLTHTQIQEESLRFKKEVEVSSGIHPTRSTPLFRASDHFVTGFKKRQKLSSHRTDIKHISKKENERDMELEKETYVYDVLVSRYLYGDKLVLNMDESPVMKVDIPVTAVVETGCSHAAHITSNAGALGTKITTIPCISAAGNKLPLSAILRGKTERCLSNIRDYASVDIKKVKLYYSEKGWINENIMLKWLNDVVNPYTHSRPAALIMDSYKAHWTNAVQLAASKMNLHLILVPPGTTSELQPLDVGFNGALVMKRKQIWSEHKLYSPFEEDTRQLAVERAQQAYAAQPKSTGVRAFRESNLLL
jgi:hypothetical protein